MEEEEDPQTPLRKEAQALRKAERLAKKPPSKPGRLPNKSFFWTDLETRTHRQNSSMS